MLNLYRILTILINIFFAAIFTFFLYNIVIYDITINKEDILIFSFLGLFVITTSYFVWNTKSIKNNFNKNEDILDFEITEVKELKKFRFQTLSTVFNFYLGIFLIGLGFYLMITFSVFDIIEPEDPYRLLITLYTIFHGTLKVYYSYCIYKIINPKKI